MVYQGIQKTFFQVNKHLEGWNRFSSLWRLDKQMFIEKLDPILRFIDEELNLVRIR